MGGENEVGRRIIKSAAGLPGKDSPVQSSLNGQTDGKKKPGVGWVQGILLARPGAEDAGVTRQKRSPYPSQPGPERSMQAAGLTTPRRKEGNMQQQQLLGELANYATRRVGTGTLPSRSAGERTTTTRLKSWLCHETKGFFLNENRNSHNYGAEWLDDNDRIS